MEPTQHDIHVPTSSPTRSSGSPRRGRGRRDGRGEVRAIARAAGRSCSRPGCHTPAAATLVFSYQEQVARLVELLDEGEPQAYDLCPAHADRTRPPVGWELSDTRPPPSDAPRRLDDDETVQVLAAALRGETPPTRVTVFEGGREDDEPAAAVPPESASPDPDEHVDEDPLRAALEELQRVAIPDDEATTTAAIATPLRREQASSATAPQPEVDPEREVWHEVEDARAASAESGQDDDLTLW